MRDRIAVGVACAALLASCVSTGAAGPVGPPGSLPPPPPQAYGVPQGEWVQTQQYGWVWMPYADAYTYLPPDGFGEPLEYLYYPSQGWVWVTAPWVWGVGPMPGFRRPGPPRFAWYEHGWWRTPQRWRYRPSPERGGPVARGVRPAPPLRPQARAAPAPAPAPAPQARTGRPEAQARPGERRGGERPTEAAPPRPAPRQGERTRDDRDRERSEDRR